MGKENGDRPASGTPLAVEGEFAFLEVMDVGPVGAFLDRGLEKQLLVPFSEQPQPMHKGERHLVRLYLDNSGRLAASARIEKFLEKDVSDLREGDEVNLLVYRMTPLGVKVIINGRFAGLLFRDELQAVRGPGARLKGYVKKIRQDGKVDVTLNKGWEQYLEKNRNRILMTLAETRGFLPLTDSSSPEEIAAALGMSKKAFKKAAGSLYKEGFVEITPSGIKLKPNPT